MKTALLFLILLFVPTINAAGNSIVATKHNLSSAGQKQICIFCHTPHNAGPAAAPLWNKKVDLSAPFKFYTSESRTIRDVPVRPNAVSLACLTCHSKKFSINMAHLGINGSTLPNESCLKCHSGSGYALPTGFTVGPDLSNDHPISIKYPIEGTEKLRPATDGNNGWLAERVRLFNGYLECSSCHQPHNNDNAPFLAKSNSRSALCLVCHIK